LADRPRRGPAQGALRLGAQTEDHALSHAARAAGDASAGQVGVLATVFAKIKTFQLGPLETVTPRIRLNRGDLELGHRWAVSLRGGPELLQYVEEGAVIVEIWAGAGGHDRAGRPAASAGDACLLGLVTIDLLPLTNFAAALLNGSATAQRYPALAVDGFKPAVNPFDGEQAAQLQVTMRLGSAEQTARHDAELRAARILQPRARGALARRRTAEQSGMQRAASERDRRLVAERGHNGHPGPPPLLGAYLGGVGSAGGLSFSGGLGDPDGYFPPGMGGLDMDGQGMGDCANGSYEPTAAIGGAQPGAAARKFVHRFTVQITSATGLPPPAPPGKSLVSGKSRRPAGRYVRYCFPADPGPFVSRAERSAATDPIFQSGEDHVLVLTLPKLRTQLVVHQGISFQVLQEEAQGRDRVLGSALLGADQLFALAEAGASQPAGHGADYSLPLRLTPRPKSAAARGAPRAAQLHVCVEYRAEPLRLPDVPPSASPCAQISLLGLHDLDAAVAAATAACEPQVGLNLYVRCLLNDATPDDDGVHTRIVCSKPGASAVAFNELCMLPLLQPTSPKSAVVFELLHRPELGPDALLGAVAVPTAPLAQADGVVAGSFGLRTELGGSLGLLRLQIERAAGAAPTPMPAVPPAAMVAALDTGHNDSADSGGGADAGTRGRITLNIPDAALAGAALAACAGSDMLFFLRFRWFDEPGWSQTRVCLLNRERQLDVGYSRSIFVEVDDALAEYVDGSELELQLLPVGGDTTERELWLGLDQRLRREVGGALEQLEQAVFRSETSESSCFNYGQLCALLRSVGVTADQERMVELLRLADLDDDGLVSGVELFAACQSIRHLDDTQDGDLLLATARFPLAELLRPGAADAEKEVHVAGGELTLMRPGLTSDAAAVGTVRAQAVLERFKPTRRTRVEATPQRRSAELKTAAPAAGPAAGPDGGMVTWESPGNKAEAMSSDYGIHVVVQQAKHVPKVCDATPHEHRPILPSCYVQYSWHNQHVATHVVRESTNPGWHHANICKLPHTPDHGMKPGSHPLKRVLEFKLYHRVLQAHAEGTHSGDLLIGAAEVDLSPLLYPGFEELNGWYHLLDFKGEGQGELKVQITPSKPIPRTWELPGKRLRLKAGVGQAPLAIGGYPGQAAAGAPRVDRPEPVPEPAVETPASAPAQPETASEPETAPARAPVPVPALAVERLAPAPAPAPVHVRIRAPAPAPEQEPLPAPAPQPVPAPAPTIEAVETAAEAAAEAAAMEAMLKKALEAQLAAQQAEAEAALRAAEQEAITAVNAELNRDKPEPEPEVKQEPAPILVSAEPEAEAPAADSGLLDDPLSQLVQAARQGAARADALLAGADPPPEEPVQRPALFPCWAQSAEERSQVAPGGAGDAVRQRMAGAPPVPTSAAAAAAAGEDSYGLAGIRAIAAQVGVCSICACWFDLSQSGICAERIMFFLPRQVAQGVTDAMWRLEHPADIAGNEQAPSLRSVDSIQPPAAANQAAAPMPAPHPAQGAWMGTPPLAGAGAPPYWSMAVQPHLFAQPFHTVPPEGHGHGPPPHEFIAGTGLVPQRPPVTHFPTHAGLEVARRPTPAEVARESAALRDARASVHAHNVPILSSPGSGDGITQEASVRTLASPRLALEPEPAFEEYETNWQMNIDRRVVPPHTYSNQCHWRVNVTGAT
jgi:hypothetical protein